jgi:hypothetical protein
VKRRMAVRVKSETEVRVKSEIEVRVKIFSAKCFYFQSQNEIFSVFYLFITKPNNSAFVEVLS